MKRVRRPSGRGLASLLVAWGCAACGGPSAEPSAASTMPDARDPAYAASFAQADDPRISRSGGPPGGVVVLYTRVVPGDQGRDALAEAMQARLVAVAERASGGRTVERRPAPERACPRAGCEAAAVGVVLLRSGTGCAAAVTVSRPGQAPARLVAWAGSLTLRETMVPFREPPESRLAVRDFVRCEELEAAVAEGDDAVEQAVREALSD